jgi:enediyne core biosynthesis thioesterase
MRAYEIRHIVGFEETNLVGNVYYVHYLRWQGRCREMFLRQHAPDVLAALEKGLALVTTRCACDYHAELSAFDEVIIRMKLASLTQNRVTMLFDYVRKNGEDEELVARGEQQIAVMQRQDTGLVAAPIPETLRQALQLYKETETPALYAQAVSARTRK